MISAQAISNDHADVFQFLRGDLSRQATGCHVPQEAQRDSLVFVSDSKQIAEARAHQPAILIIRAGAVEALAPTLSDDGCYFSVKSVSMGMATLLKYFDRKSERFTSWGQRHPTAVIHPSAQVHASAVIGPFCSIGARTVIGAGTLIGAHCVMENDVAIGAGSIIHPHVFIGARCRLGHTCEIHPHTTIGSDGFGYAVDGDGRPRKIAHLGNVVIGDHVEIGSNCAVDRATLTSTFIRSGTKIDNICHIAHNCDLGENGFYTAGFMMGGSTKIGRHFVCGGNAVVTAHVTVGDNVTLAGRSTVTKDVPSAGSYGGYPLQPLADAMRTVVNIGRLNELSKQLNRVRKHLGLS